MGWFGSSRKKGLTSSEMRGSAFRTGVHSKIIGALKKSNSNVVACKKDGMVEAVIEAALVSGYHGKKVAEPTEVLAGLEKLEHSRMISGKEKTAISKAIAKELNN